MISPARSGVPARKAAKTGQRAEFLRFSLHFSGSRAIVTANIFGTNSQQKDNYEIEYLE